LLKYQTFQGSAESNILECAKKEGIGGLLDTLNVKPGFGITEDGMSPRYMMAWPLGVKAIKINKLAASRIYVALNGN
jgi:hypothetical protein